MFRAGSIAEWHRLVEERQHFGDAMYYRQMLASENLGSSSNDLVRRGFMRDLRVEGQWTVRGSADAAAGVS